MIKQHKESGLWVTDDGRVIMPPCRRYPNFRFTFGHKNKNGYMEVQFRGKRYFVHKLVIEAFTENKLGLPTTDHKNRVRDDNRLENLRFGSYKLQSDNRQVCEDSLAKYGVRGCEDHAAYARALRAKNPEYAERQRTLCHEWSVKHRANPEYAERERARNRAYRRERRARDPEYALKQRANCREWEAKQRALGRRYRRCPDGKKHWLTDEEFNERYKEA